MESTIKKYLPKKPFSTEKKHLVAVHIPVSLFSEVNQYRKKKNLAWTELVRASFMDLIENVIRKEK